MPIFNPRLTGVDIAETKRYAGLSRQAFFPEQLLADACVLAHILAQPTSYWQLYPYDNKQGMILSPSPLALQDTSIVSHLAKATAVAVLALTIGAKLEQEVTHLFSNGDYTQGLLLDCGGTTAVESAADQLSELIRQHVSKQGLITLPRFSPGYGNWNITIQPQILNLSHGQTVGINVTESCMLLPRKSITAIIGLVASGQPASHNACNPHTCNNCTQINCIARKEPSHL